jgi:hypothetical protein
MTVMRSPLAERLSYWRVRGRAWRRRATGFGLWLRATVFLSGFAVILVAAPAPVRWQLGLLLAVVLPLLAMARPDLAWVTGVEFVALAGWLIQVLLSSEPPVFVAGLVGAAMYLHHSAAALAAQCRTDVAVDDGIRRTWLHRTGAVMGGSLALSTFIAGLAGQPLPLPAPLLLAAGVTGALAATATVVHLLLRRRTH